MQSKLTQFLLTKQLTHYFKRTWECPPSKFKGIKFCSLGKKCLNGTIII